jgi:Zn-dependent M32 family carboxypeptidase
MTIRRTLIGLFLVLGLALCTAVALHAWTAVRAYYEAQELTKSNLAREQLARAAAAVAEERTEAYLALLDAEGTGSSIDELRQETNQVFQEVKATIQPLDSWKAGRNWSFCNRPWKISGSRLTKCLQAWEA